MRIRPFLPFLVLAGLILVVGIACGSPTPSVPTKEVFPTAEEPVVVALQPTDTPVPAFFTEYFLGDLSQWYYYVFLGSEDMFTNEQTDNGLRVELTDPDIYVYFFYDPYTYTDVILDTTFKNLAHNSNNVNLVCRYSEDGRYQFTVQNDGLYQIWAYDQVGGTHYTLLANGGSTAIRSGNAENEVMVSCIGNELTLYINGTETRTVSDNRFFFEEGQVGFGLNASPANPVVPVTVEFEMFTIAEP